MNIRSIAKNFDEFKLFLELTSQSYDIIVLTETFQIFDSQFFNIQGYDSLYNNGNYNKNDGILIYVKNGITFTQKIVQLGDVRALELDVSTQESTEITKITAIYRSPHSCVTTFNKNLNNYLQNLENCSRHILVGDMNIDLLSGDNFSEV